VTAGEELHREILEVLHATRQARAAGTVDETKIAEETEAQQARVDAAVAKIEALRGSLWVPKGAVVANAADTVVTAPVLEGRLETSSSS
jgi:hypothetical protein